MHVIRPSIGLAHHSSYMTHLNRMARYCPCRHAYSCPRRARPLARSHPPSLTRRRTQGPPRRGHRRRRRRRRWRSQGRRRGRPLLDGRLLRCARGRGQGNILSSFFSPLIGRPNSFFPPESGGHILFGFRAVSRISHVFLSSVRSHPRRDILYIHTSKW